jgi:TolA-binding protein
MIHRTLPLPHRLVPASLLRSALAALVVALPAPADMIVRTDGPPIEDATVLRADLREVEYRAGGRDKQTIATDRVVRIEFDRYPTLLDRAQESLRTGDVAAALNDISAYVDSIFAGDKGDKRFPWAPAWALQRLIALRGNAGDLQGVIAAADRLIQQIPDSMYVPPAYLAKAEALLDQDKADQALAALRALVALVEGQGLSNRWKLEAEIAIAQADPSLKGAARRERYSQLAGQAGAEFPIVRARAEVAEAEILVAEQEFDAAQSILQGVVASGAADDRTLAAAYTGLGDCHYQAATKFFKQGKQKEAEEQIRKALLAYMRVVVSFSDQARYVARGMFFAGRAFDQLQDEESKSRAQQMYREVLRQFPASSWAKEAKDFRR